MVKKGCKPRGRPRHFEEDVALDEAVKVFWAKGFDGASLDDLVAATGVSRPSLYATFGDKEALFLRCIERYTEQMGTLAVEALNNGAGVRSSMASFLRQTVERTTGERTPSGCLMASVVPLVKDPKVKEFAARAQEQAGAMIERRLEAAVAAGELPSSFPCAARSRQIGATAMALALHARMGTPRATLLTDADEAIALIFGAAGGAA